MSDPTEHVRQHVTFMDLGTPNASMHIEWFCPEYPDDADPQILSQSAMQHAIEAIAAALSSPETTPAGVLAVDAERLAAAFQAEIGGPVSAYARERAGELAAEYNRLGGAPKEDWQCQTVGCYLHAGHASEHEPGMCECGADMEAHSGGWTLLHHDQFMEGLRAAPAGVLDEAALPTEAVYGPCSCGQAEVRQSEWFSASGGHHGHRIPMAVALRRVPISDRRHRNRRAAALGRSGSGGGDKPETMNEWLRDHYTEGMTRPTETPE